jgi:formate dehydrogenase (NADP+) beta subunit
VRIQRPIYRDLMPPCNHACPAGENIQEWLSLSTSGKYREAWDVIVRDNPFPAIHGRVCYHPCESNCNRGEFDSAVSIHAIERFLGDTALEQGWTPTIHTSPTGKRILVIGAGPSGLSCAHHLALAGHSVEIRDAAPKAGGMMRFGIPAYRLPRNILDGEIARLERMGVAITLNHRVEDLSATQKEGNFDAVFLAIGAHLGKKTEIPARDAGTILDAVSFLRDVESGQAPKLGRRVAIYGGGNTAMDAARVAARLGSDPMIIYRRDRQHMPAHPIEADEAIEEGVNIHWLRTIKSIAATTITVERMEIDERGRPVGTGELETIEADDLILALGQDTDTGFLHKVEGIEFQPDGTVVVDGQMMTGHPGIFAGGDMVPSERTVTIAVGHGKKAARNINGYLNNAPHPMPEKKDVVGFDKLKLWFFSDVTPSHPTQMKLELRRDGFGEVVGSLTESQAKHEANRCFSCGNCFECDGCYGACPEDAIIMLGPGNRYEFDYNKCTGCSTCYEQCPCHAISVIPEPKVAGSAL